MSANTIHEAGDLVESVQRCRRCETILADYRGAMVLDGDPAPRGFAPGASIEVEGAGSFVTDDPPNCTKIDRIVGAAAEENAKAGKSIADQKIEHLVEESRAETERGRLARRKS